MIKISKYVYIHFLTICLFVSAYITRTLEITALMYSVMFIHELAHALSAKLMGLKISKIVFYPFGVQLRLDSLILLSFSEEIILYLSGPLINVLFALIMTFIATDNLFYINNIVLFLLNILPISPLDGGRVMEAFISNKIGRKNAKRVMKVISAGIYAIFLILVCKNRIININTITFIAFLFGSILFEKEKYSVDLLKELSMNDEKKQGRSEIFVFYKDTPKSKIIREFNPSKRAIVAFVDNSENIISLKTDRVIIKSMLKEENLQN